MINYATIGSNRLEEAKAFYDALLGSIGAKILFEHPTGGRLYGQPGVWMFGVLKPYNDLPASVGNGTMVGFHLDSPEQIAAFHAKALELGGTNEGDPSPGIPPENEVFKAYFRDLDGNKVCAYRFGRWP